MKITTILIWDFYIYLLQAVRGLKIQTSSCVHKPQQQNSAVVLAL